MQITSLYGGPLEFLFIVESTDDPAYRAVSLLISDFQVDMLPCIYCFLQLRQFPGYVSLYIVLLMAKDSSFVD